MATTYRHIVCREASTTTCSPVPGRPCMTSHAAADGSLTRILPGSETETHTQSIDLIEQIFNLCIALTFDKNNNFLKMVLQSKFRTRSGLS